jgi:glyoxylase-like metal-dependent hydrolase (beta-lactamase superfamily II)
MSSVSFARIGERPSTHLKWNTFVTPSVPVVAPDIAPGEAARPWPPISSTLIYSVRDAVLVDSFITHEQAMAQADWIASTGKNLTTRFATHGYGDHCFGASVLLERFPRLWRHSGNRVSRISSQGASWLPRNLVQM